MKPLKKVMDYAIFLFMFFNKTSLKKISLYFIVIFFTLTSRPKIIILSYQGLFGNNCHFFYFNSNDRFKDFTLINCSWHLCVCIFPLPWHLLCKCLITYLIEHKIVYFFNNEVRSVQFFICWYFVCAVAIISWPDTLNELSIRSKCCCMFCTMHMQ